MMEYYRFFVDAWRFFKRQYQSAEDTDAWWDQMISGVEELTDRYHGRSFANEILVAITNELERKVRAGRSN